MVTGSIASSLYGEPRLTHDIDIVVALAPDSIDVFLRAFQAPAFYLSCESILGAIGNQSMFNLLDVLGGDKVDFWILTTEPFDCSRFSRRRRQTVEATQIDVSTPEDTILAKLRWSELSGGSEKQFQDALRVYEVQYAALDIAYINHWAGHLNVEPLWRRLQTDAEVV
jgi:hypothetical protein